MTADLALRGGSLRAPAFGATVLRCALYLGPLSVAVAAAGPLARVSRPVTAGTLLLGWSVAHALSGVGAVVARRCGRGPAATVVARGFAAAAAFWVVLVLVAPAGLVGADRGLAVTVGLCGLLSLGTVTVALVTRTEATVLRWSLPCWLLAAVGIAGLVGDTLAETVPVTVLIPFAVALAAARAFRPVLGSSPVGRLRPDDLRYGGIRLLLGAAQAACVALLWHVGPPAAASLAVIPVLAAGPVLEALIGWHHRQVQAGLDVSESDGEFRAHLSDVTVVTVAALLPPLAVGTALAAAALRLPGGTRAAVLVFAGGILLSGVLAITLLLGWRGRTGVATLLAMAPPAGALVVSRVLPAEPLSAVVALLAATHLAGLLIVARTAADPRRTP